MFVIAQQATGGPRGGGAGAKWVIGNKARSGVGATGRPDRLKSASETLGGGATRSVTCRQNGQWSGCTAQGGTSGESAGTFRAIQRGPSLVQISTSGASPPRASTMACDTVGANAANTAISSASHTVSGRRSAAKNGRCVIGKISQKTALPTALCGGQAQFAGPKLLGHACHDLQPA